MDKNKTIVITGAAGFIGSFLAKTLNEKGYHNLVLIDDFSYIEKVNNTKNLRFSRKIHREQFQEWWKNHRAEIDFVFHIGARTDTTEQDPDLLKELNTDYTKWVWEFCALHEIPLIYASSAATYGNGTLGYKDDESLITELKPLNPYGDSKNEFDIWALKQIKKPPFWAGMKFFNVYGPQEYHKGRMASVVYHAFKQIIKTGEMNLFRSHHPDFKDGEQLRDFIYVKDVVKVLIWMMDKQINSGIYNLGTGKARSFIDLSTAVFKNLNLKTQINFIDTPEDIRENYQYFTEADMSKLINAGYPLPFYSLEEGVADYVNNYLKKEWHQ